MLRAASRTANDLYGNHRHDRRLEKQAYPNTPSPATQLFLLTPVAGFLFLSANSAYYARLADTSKNIRRITMEVLGGGIVLLLCLIKPVILILGILYLITGVWK